MIVEREIEETLIDKLRGALQEREIVVPRTTGAWSVANDGEVKGRDEGESVAMSVAVGLRSYDSFQTATADFPCGLVLAISRDACPTGAAIAEYIEPLMDKLHRWNADEEAVFNDLETEHFHPAGFQLADGDGPEYDKSTGAWTITLLFNLKGRVD